MQANHIESNKNTTPGPEPNLEDKNPDWTEMFFQMLQILEEYFSSLTERVSGLSDCYGFILLLTQLQHPK